MKIKMEFDISPNELREVFGLPNVQPLHEEVMEKMRGKILEGVESYDPMNFLSTYSIQTGKTLQEMQQAIWNGFGVADKQDDDS